MRYHPTRKPRKYDAAGNLLDYDAVTGVIVEFFAKDRVFDTIDSKRIGTVTMPGPECCEIKWDDGKIKVANNKYLRKVPPPTQTGPKQFVTTRDAYRVKEARHGSTYHRPRGTR